MSETNRRKRLLMIDEEFSYPLNSGKRLRTYNLLCELSRHYDITCLAYGHSNSEGFRQFQQIGVTPVAVDPPNRDQHGPGFFWRLFANLFSPDPYIVTSHYTHRFQNRLRQLLLAQPYDAVICEWTPYARFVKEIPDVRKIISSHNIEAAIWRRYEQQETNLARRLYIKLQRAKVEAFETDCYQWVDGAIAVSEYEARTIADLGVLYTPAVVENGVDADFFVCQPDINPDEVVFSGSMDWRPNQDAVTWFVEEILPLIRKKRPKARFTIVGRKPPQRIRELGNRDGITVTGTVDDVRPYLGRAAVHVVPLRIGGGSRLKILEGMAMQKAVVSTTVGAEGLRVTDGANILLADNPHTFAEAVNQCLEDRELRRRLGENGRELIEREYRWSILGRKMHEYICRILNQN